MKGGAKDSYNQYQTRQNQIDQLIEGRYTNSEQQAEWFYDKEVKEMSSKNKYKYQDVIMSRKIGFLDDMRQLIFDQKRSPEDLHIFTTDSNWRLVGFEEHIYDPPLQIPSRAYLQFKGGNSDKLDQHWGRVELEGRLSIKLHQTGYAPRHFNLRRRVLCFYPIAEPQMQEKQELMVQFNQTSFSFQSQNEEYFSLKFGERTVKIRKEAESREAIKAMQRILFLCSFKGAYCLRNEIPSENITDYVIKEINTIKGVDFVHEHKNKDIVGSRYYKESIGGFFYLLNKESFKRKTLSMDLTYPNWLKPQYSALPNCDLNMITNVVPKKAPLMNLKIKLHQSQIGALNQNLKYIFPFRRQFVKRTLVVYESNLQDNHVNYMMNQISYPMFMIGLPKNQLSLIGLEYVINAAGTLCHQTIDFSYNSKLISISGPKIFTMTNANPSLKKLTLKGCYVSLGEESQFFEGLASNMCLKEFQIDYMDSYNDAMISHLGNYDGQIY